MTPLISNTFAVAAVKPSDNTAVVSLYKRGATAPAKPTETLTYTFATGVCAGSLNGWSQTVPASNGQPCWVIQATAFSDSPTDSIAPNEWSTQMKFVEDGQKGVTVYLYKRSLTKLTAHGITATLTYTFSTKELTPAGSLNGWTLTIPTNSDAPIYVIAAVAASTTDTDTIAANEWSTPAKMSENGLNSAAVFLYKRSSTALSAHGITADATYTFATGVLSGSLNGWSQTIPAANGNPCYVIQATAISTEATDKISASEWSAPVKYVIDGADAFIADLSNEADLFATDSTGKTTSAQNRTTKCHMYLGSNIQKLTASPSVSLKYATSGNAVAASVAETTTASGINTTEGTVTVQVKSGQTITDAIYADITLTCAAGSKTVRFTLKPVNAGKDGEVYQLAPDHDALPFTRNDSNVLSPDSIRVYAYVNKTIGETTTKVTSALSNYRVYYGFDENAATSYIQVGSYIDITNADAENYRFLWFELRKGSAYNAWEDRETLPITKDGKKGGNGETGNGIDTVTFYRMFTQTFSAPDVNDSNWKVEGSTNFPTEAGLSKTNRFLWQKKKTTYTKTADVDNEISLLAQFESGVCANLLLDTAFHSEGQLEAWNEKSKYSVISGQEVTADTNIGVNTSYTLDGMNSYYDKAPYDSTKIQYKEVLRQLVWDYDGIKKIGYSDWYTLSFWVRGTSYSKLSTYIYPSCIDTTKAFYVDGVKQSYTPSDGHVDWTCTGSWVRHTVTFQTRSSFYQNVNGSYVYDDQHVFFRLQPNATAYNNCYICMPKLERNTIATEWLENEGDRIAADFQHIYVGEWVSGTTYYYANGVRHVVRARTSSGSMTYFRMRKRTVSTGYVSTRQPYIDTTNWEQASYLRFVATEMLIAEEAIINFAQTNRILVYNSSGTVAAGMGGAEGGVNDFPLWVGATYANRGSAPFRVTLGGKLFATEANIVGKIEGSIRNPFMLVNDSFSTYDKDNLVMMTSGGSWTEAFSLPWDINQAGRTIRVLSYKWNANSSPTSGWGSISAPSGQYFYEGGKQYSVLYFSREIIELLGYGTSTTFYGWIVMRRIDLMTERTYGLEQKTLCYGRIHGNQDSGVSFSNYMTCDKSTLTVSRTGTGLYKITIPTNWRIFSSELMVTATPVGYIKGGNNMLFCSVESIETNGAGYVQYVSLQCSDDQSRDDGDIFFAMYNMSDWKYLTGE